MEVLELKFTYSAMIRLWLEIFNMLFIGVIIAVNTPDMSRGDFITDQIVA